MHIDVEAETSLVLAILFVITLYLLWIMSGRPTISLYVLGRRPHLETVQKHLNVEPSDTKSAANTSDQCYAVAALRALQKHSEAITNINPVQTFPTLYSNYLISAETLSIVSTTQTTNKMKTLAMFEELRSNITMSSTGFVTFVDVLRRFPEYDGLANDLQGTYDHQCSAMKLPIQKKADTVTEEKDSVPFKHYNDMSPELVTLEAKLNVPPENGWQNLNAVVQNFTQQCDIGQSCVSGISMGKNCFTVSFQVSTTSLPTLEKTIVDSTQALCKLNVCFVKILGKTVFEADFGRNALLKKTVTPETIVGFIPELEAVGTSLVTCQHHGVLQGKTSRSSTVVHDGMVCIGGGTTGRSKKDLSKVILYNPDTQHTSFISALVKFFSLAVINGSLTTVGGFDKKVPSNKICRWDKTKEQWYESYPPMPTARRSTTSITFGSYLIVIGGALPETVTIVEVLDLEQQKWYSGPSLPEEMYNVQTVVIGNTLYLLGGATMSVLFCSLPTLITSAISSLSYLSKLWKKLPSLLYRFSAAVLLGRHLLAIGGHDEKATNMTDSIHSYSPHGNCWERVGSLRTGRRNCAAVRMSDERVFVMGGADSPAYDNYCEDVEVMHLQTSISS